MNERIKDKVEEIEQYLSELEEILPDNFKEYTLDFKAKAACERYAEKIIEAAIDLAFLFIKTEGLPQPENDLQAFDILLENRIIPEELAGRLQDAKRMRNIIAHEYGEIDDEIVFKAVKEELIGDVGRFIEIIKKRLTIF